MNTIEQNLIKHISFDLWGTLIKSHPEYKKTRAEAIFDFIRSAYNTPRIKALTFPECFDIIRFVEKACDFSNEATGKQLGQLYCFELLIERIGVVREFISRDDLQLLSKTLFQILKQYPPRIIGGDDTVDLLSKIKEANISMNIASNTSFITGAEMESVFIKKYFSDLFAFKIYSDELGHSKPAYAFFDKIWEMTKANCRMGHILHLGDNVITDGAAQAFGMQFSLVKNNDIIQSLTELKKYLCCKITV